MLGKRWDMHAERRGIVSPKPLLLFVNLVVCAFCCGALVACAQPASTGHSEGTNESAQVAEPVAEKNETVAENETAAAETAAEGEAVAEEETVPENATDSSKAESASAHVSAPSKTPGDEKMKKAESDVRALVKDYGDRVAVSVSNLDGNSGFAINDDKEFKSASMIKLLILARLLGAEHSGTLDVSHKYELASKDIVGGTGHISGSPIGTAFTYDELASAMIAYSDNTATNVLIDTLGMDSVNKEAKALGLKETRLQRKMMDTSGKTENFMSARDATTLLFGFANGTIAGKDESAKAIEYLKAQTDKDGLAKGVPEDVRFAHKTGTLADVRHDGGVVYADDPYAIVVFTSLGEADANNLMAKVSSAVYEALKG